MKKENPFKQIDQPSKKAPFGLKQKIMNDLASVKLLTDLAEFFTSNYRNTIANLFLTNNK